MQQGCTPAPGLPKSAGARLHQAAKSWPYRWAGTSGAKLSFPMYAQSGFLTPVHAFIFGAFTCFSSTSFPVQCFARPSLLSANGTMPMGRVRAKSWLLGCPEVASPVSQGLCCGGRAPGCILGLLPSHTHFRQRVFCGHSIAL